MEKEKLDKMYDICFFDLDGTIIDSSPGITNSVMYALEKFGIEETEREKLYKFIGPPLTDSFARFYGFDDEKSWKAVEYYREYYQDTGIFECSVYPGFEKSLKALKAAVDFIVSPKMLKIGKKKSLQRLYNELLNKDWFMTLLDLEDYIKVKNQALADYTDREKWAKKMLVNISKAGFFSSDRTIEQYNEDIWHLTK